LELFCGSKMDKTPDLNQCWKTGIKRSIYHGRLVSVL
jgi:hypothetical protein